MLRNFYLLGLMVLVFTSSMFAQVGSGTLKGKLTDSQTGEPLPFVNIVLQSGDQQVAGGATDFDGNYTIKPIPPGTYNLLISYVGYNAKKIEGVKINNSKITFLDVPMESGIKLDEFEVIEYEVPLIDKDGGSSGGTVTREDISRMPGRSATSIAATVGGVQQTNDGVSLRGAREANTFYYIDGVKVRGSSNLPKAAIEEVAVLTGGIPANYGDATGGIIAITTRGASSRYFGGIDIITSGFANEDGKGIGLDRFSQTQIEGVFSGPLLWRKDAEGERTTPLLGFFTSLNYTNNLDNRPTIGQYRIKQSTRDDLVANPLLFNQQGTTTTASGVYLDEGGSPVISNIITPNVQGTPRAELIRSEDWEEVPARQNARLQRVSATLKLDVATAPNFDLSFGGTFTADNDNIYDYDNSLFNSANNGQENDRTIRGFGRFTQRFDSDEEEDGLIKNAFYSIMVDYSQRNVRREDPRHKDRLFNYGYVGKFETIEVPNYIFRDDTSARGFYQENYTQLATNFTPSDVNSDLASFTSALYRYYDQLGAQVRTTNDIVAAGAFINGPNLDGLDVIDLYRTIGRPYNEYRLFDQNQFRITGSGSADIGEHAITLGFEFEQFTERNFRALPIQLWTQARLNANQHLSETDFSAPTSVQRINNQNYYSFDRAVELDDQGAFDRNLRIKLGLDPNGNDFIYVDELNPDFFELDMFSADELIRDGNNSLVDYYGYDYSGQKLTGARPSIEDFFQQRDENGELLRPIAAFEPIYIAGYIMDKFAFDDIIFNVGVRIDRYDANQSVLKDQFVIGNAATVNDALNAGSDSKIDFPNHPSNVQGDWVVYVNDLENPTAINGYRDGDQFYNAVGTPISDPAILRTANGIAPLLLDRNAIGANLDETAFEDYKPQINVMPRVSFSFPISDEAVFFAHYDILTQRPTGQNVASPVDYLLIRNLNRAIDNPNLKPTRTTDYELGFQQVLSRSSSLKITAFYRETRDEIQARQLREAFPVTYTTYDNFDFGTTKGLTLTYDLRRTGNVTLRAAYTLQFASATGSGSNSGLNLANSGEPNLRVIFPTDRDQRHLFIGTFDYRYGMGKDYNGPVLFGKQIFAQTGLNIVGTLASGTPYSQQQIPVADANILPTTSRQLEGSPNGSRLPSQFRINAQLDKSFGLRFGKNGQEQKQAFLNVYLLVNNLLNAQNIIDVYRFTGNPDDDGYLSAPRFQPQIDNQVDPTSFRQLYALKVADPFNYSIPRVIQLGLRLDF